MAAQQPETDPIMRALERIADGSSMRAACIAVGIDKRTLWEQSLEPTYAPHYVRAREMQAEHDASRIDDSASELLELARSGQPVDNGTVQAYARAIDALKWSAARKHPKVYGDRIEVSGKQDVHVTVSLGAAPALSLPNTDAPRTIEAQLVSADAALPPSHKAGSPTVGKSKKRARGPNGG